MVSHQLAIAVVLLPNLINLLKYTFFQSNQSHTLFLFFSYNNLSLIFQISESIDAQEDKIMAEQEFQDIVDQEYENDHFNDENMTNGHEAETIEQIIESCKIHDEKFPKHKLEAVKWGYFERLNTNMSLVHDWSKQFPCGCGSRQSPIDIKISDCQQASFAPLVLKTDKKDLESLSNGGMGVKYQCKGRSELSGGPLLKSDTYALEQFHFHWGANDTVGSEHLLNGEAYPCELHCVYYNKKYGNFMNALSHGDGLCVVGVFIKVQENDNPGYQPVIEMLKQVKFPDTSTNFNGEFSIEEMMPADKQHFSHYEGSLTTPPLSESVMWINLLDEVGISQKQLEVFRCLMNPAGKPLVDNYRPVQPIHERKVHLQSKAQQ